MAMKPIPLLTPLGTTESSGNIEQTETKIDCVFTYGNPSESGRISSADVDDDCSLGEYKYLQEKINNGETLSDIEQARYEELCIYYDESDDVNSTSEEIKQQIEGINSELFDNFDYIYNLVLEEHPELKNSTNEMEIFEYCRAKKLEIIHNELGIEIPENKDEQNALICAYDAIERGARLGMKELNIPTKEEYYRTVSPAVIEEYEARANNNLKDFSEDYVTESETRSNRIGAIDRVEEEQEYYNALLAFYKDNAKNIKDKNITDVETLKKSEDFANIEYQYLKAKADRGESLSAEEKIKLDAYQKVLDQIGNLKDYRFPSGGDGSYLAEFNTEKYRLENMYKNGEGSKDKLKEDVINKINADLEKLPSEQRRDKILEIIGTAKDEEESKLIAQALIELQNKNKELISAENLYNVLKDSGIKIPAIASLYGSLSEEMKLVFAKDLLEKVKSGELQLTATQFEAIWNNFSDDIKKMFNETCGDKVTELLAQAKNEIAEMNTDKGSNDNNTTNGSAGTGNTLDKNYTASDYIENYTPTENRNPFAQPSEQFGITDDEQPSIPQLGGTKQSSYKNSNGNIEYETENESSTTTAELIQQFINASTSSEKKDIIEKNCYNVSFIHGLMDSGSVSYIELGNYTIDIEAAYKIFTEKIKHIRYSDITASEYYHQYIETEDKKIS